MTATNFGIAWLILGAVIGVYAAVRHFKDDSEDWNMLVTVAFLLGLVWPVTLAVLVYRSVTPKAEPDLRASTVVESEDELIKQ